MNGNTKNDFKTEFQTFCSILHENLLHNGKHHQIMTQDTERTLLDYLLDQDNSECSEELSSWVQKFVFCVVSDEPQSKFELHVWDDENYQKKVVALEDYFVTLSNLYLQYSSVSLENFQKKVKEMYVLIPESVVKYFYDHFSEKGSGKKTKLMYAKKREDKENKGDSCRVICYDYIKKKVMKRKVITDKIDKTSGNVISSKFHEEMVAEDFVYCLQKSEKLFDISNGQSTELSSSNYTASEPLEVKFLNKSVIAYFPPDEMKNHDHLVTFSDLIYNDQGISPEKSQTIQMEFVVPKESPQKSLMDMNFNVDEALQEDDHSSYIPKKKPKKPATSKKKRKSKKENVSSSASAQKLTIITDPVTKGATLRIDPNSENDTANLEQQSFSSLFAAAMEEETSASDVPHSEEHKDEVRDQDYDSGEQDTENNFENKEMVTVQVMVEDGMGSPEKFEIENVKVENIPQNILSTENTSTLQVETDNEKEVVVIKEIVIKETTDEKGTADDMEMKLVKPSEKTAGGKSSPKKSKQSIAPFNHSLRKPSRVILTKDAKKLEKTGDVINNNDDIDVSDSEIFEDDIVEIESDSEEVNSEKVKVRRSLRKACPKVNKASIEIPSITTPGPAENKESEIEPNSDTRLDEKELKCSLCPRRFKSKSGLYYHEQGHKVTQIHQCEQCGNEFPNRYCLRQHVRRMHLDLVIKREYSCEFCGKTFKSWSGCDYHRTKEHMDMTTTCELCGKNYPNIYSYRNHVNDIHSGKKRIRKKRGPQKCKECGKVFKSHSGLDYHKATRHRGGEKLICTVCGANLSSQKTLQIHMANHEGKVSPVTCTICGKKYASKNSLSCHMLIHRKAISAKCKHCDKTFPSKEYLRRHEKRVHIELFENPKIFQCELCEKNFKSLKSFKYHVLSHTGEKPFECSDCGKRFRSKGTLYVHKKTHTGTKDHVCTFCGDSFVQRSNMIRHVKKHHGEG